MPPKPLFGQWGSAGAIPGGVQSPVVSLHSCYCSLTFLMLPLPHHECLRNSFLSLLHPFLVAYVSSWQIHHQVMTDWADWLSWRLSHSSPPSLCPMQSTKSLCGHFPGSLFSSKTISFSDSLLPLAPSFWFIFPSWESILKSKYRLQYPYLRLLA